MALSNLAAEAQPATPDEQPGIVRNAQRERARLRPRPGSRTRHLFPARPEQPPRRTARQPEQDGELPAMGDAVAQDRRPQEVADRPLVAAEVLERAAQAS